MPMTKEELVGLLKNVPDDAVVFACIHPDSDEESLKDLSEGSVLDFEDAGYVAGMHVLYVKPR